MARPAASRPEDAASGDGDREVGEGECLHQIAAASGHLASSLWALPENRPLAGGGRTQGVLRAGDRIAVPPVRAAQCAVPGGARHRFRRKGVPLKVRLRFLDGDDPLADVDFEVETGGRSETVVSDADGFVEFPVDPGATDCALRLLETGEVFTIELGHLDPHRSLRGVRQRLENLGYLQPGSPEDDAAGLETALAAFQAQEGLAVSGEPDDGTCDALQRVHGS